jgi:hypothetical protein
MYYMHPKVPFLLCMYIVKNYVSLSLCAFYLKIKNAEIWKVLPYFANAYAKTKAQIGWGKIEKKSKIKKNGTA